jgi:RNA polymerase primary sigma factor
MIAQRLHCDCDGVGELLDISRELLSLDAPSFSDNEFSPLGDFVKDEGGSHPEVLLLKGSLRDDIKGVLSSLPQRESEILKCRFGLNDEAPMTLEALGSRYKVTKERIRQIEQKALKHLKLPSRSRLLEAYADKQSLFPPGG